MAATQTLDDRIRLALPQVSRAQAQEIAHSLLNPARKPLTACVLGNILAQQNVRGRLWKDLVEEGIIQPDGMVDGATMTYAVVLEPCSQAQRTTEEQVREREKSRKDELRSELKKLDQRIWKNGWLLAQPDKIEKFLPALREIDKELRAKGAIGSVDISRHELSYKLFGNEKALAVGEAKSMLRSAGLMHLVRYRIDSSVDLEHFIPRRRECMSVVILENRDPYQAIRSQLYEHGRARVFGQKVDGVVYAQGAAILSKLGDLLNLQESLEAKSIELLFWGDLDRAGIDELHRLMSNELGIRVQPFGPAYKKMIGLAMERFPEASDNEPTAQASIENLGVAVLSDSLNLAEMVYADSVLGLNKRVPQEIVTKDEMFKRPVRHRSHSLPKLLVGAAGALHCFADKAAKGTKTCAPTTSTTRCQTSSSPRPRPSRETPAGCSCCTEAAARA